MMMTNQIWRPTLHRRNRSAASAACLPPWEHLLKIRGKWRHWLECAKWKGVTRRQGAKLPMNACLVSWSGHKLMTALVENYDSCISYLESKFYPVCTFSYREEVPLLGQKLNQNRFMGKSKPKYLSYHHRWSLPAPHHAFNRSLGIYSLPRFCFIWWNVRVVASSHSRAALSLIPFFLYAIPAKTDPVPENRVLYQLRKVCWG